MFGLGEGAAGRGRAQPNRIYLDDAAGAPILPEVDAAVRELPEANPSSLHAEGRAARAVLDQARDLFAAQLGADRTEITFTASGTEAVNLAIVGVARRLGKNAAILTWAVEHQSVIAAMRQLEADGQHVTIAPVDGDGRANASAITANTAFVSIGLANNEVGTIQPVAEIIDSAHAAGALVHVDACCGPRWIPVPANADLVSFSGHKLGAGSGGALFVRDGLRIDPLFHGGPQEWGRRAGREDVRSAVATATALAVCTSQRAERSTNAAHQAATLRQTLAAAGGKLTSPSDCLPNFATATFTKRRGEDMLLALDLAGIAASSGSACASGSLDPSHVLLAMGMDLDEALGSLRLTTGYATTDEQIANAATILTSVLTPTTARA